MDRFTRGHRIVGPLSTYREEKHWTIGTILAITAVALAAVGTGVSIYAASEQAAAQKKALRFQQKAREQEAESARLAAAYEERQFRRRLSLLQGKQEASLAATGLDPSSGTPLLLQLDTAKQVELEALNIRRTGEVSAQGSELEARFARMKMGMVDEAAGYSMLASGLQGTSSVLSSWSTSQGMNRTKSPWAATTAKPSQIYSY